MKEYESNKIIKRQRETIESLKAENRALKREAKKYREVIIKLNGITMRTLHDD